MVSIQENNYSYYSTNNKKTVNGSVEKNEVTIPFGSTGVKKTQGDWFNKWINDEDKVSTDGKDDGKISFKEKAASFGKGLMGLVKTVVKNPLKTAAVVAGGIALTVATGGAALPALVAVGVASGAAQIGVGAYKAATAKTDGEAKQAWETMGNGTFAVASSALGAKSALKAANNAGVTSAAGADEMSMLQATGQCFKSSGESLKVSGANIKTNFLSATKSASNIFKASSVADDILKAGSKELDDAIPYMSKANEAQAYRFSANGTPEEIIANNKGVTQIPDEIMKSLPDEMKNYIVDGKAYGVKNKWFNPNQEGVKPYEAYHFIDPSKEQMVMMYGPDDMAVCDGGVFKGSYVNTEGFKANGALNYQDPSKLPYNQVIDVTKQAPGAYKVVPAGTKVQTLEGVKVVQDGQVVALDHAGNPYVTPISNILKRNMPTSPEGTKAFEELAKLTQK